MSSLNISVLGAARETYTEQLLIHLTPLLHEGFISLYEDAKRKEDETPEYNGNYLKQFQKLLCDVPYWNQSILEEETRRILHEVDFLMELVAAVFVSHVKILASVKLGGQNSNIRIKIPTSDVFIHTVYSKAAEMFYYNPYKFQNYNLRENHEGIRDMIDKSITDTINTMIPIESILKEYLSKVFTGHVKDPTGGRQVEQLPVEQPGHLLSNADLGLDDDNDNASIGSVSTGDSPINDDFGTGGDFGGDFPSDELEVGNAPSDPFGGSSGFNDSSKDLPFRDDDNTTIADIFNEPKKSDSTPFKSALDNIGEDPFKDTDGGGGSGEEIDPFKDTGGGSGGDTDPFATGGSGGGGGSDDPFASGGSGGGDIDPFASGGSGGGSDDPFASGGGSDDIFKNDNPSPPELKEDIFAPKPDEIKFFDDLP